MYERNEWEGDIREKNELSFLIPLSLSLFSLDRHVFRIDIITTTDLSDANFIQICDQRNVTSVVHLTSSTNVYCF